ncbi:MAG: DUF5686 and carboxypeptidase regulatory-like domain-containing protein [Raineya sp.]|nr:DUF5686 and carboxypeptidase regulatory-like domain-containing protein [Raineya sp.]
MKIGCFIICIFLSIGANAQNKATLQGKIVGEKNEPLAFASIYLKNTTIGTTTNAVGFYSLAVPLGEHEVVVQFPSYQTKTQKITISQVQTYMLDFQLELESQEIEAITVQGKFVNYAEEVIRNAQKNRKKYLEERPDFQCEVYVKTLFRLDKKPERIFGESTVGLDTGVVYLSESVSEVSYQKNPRRYKEVVVASKVSGDSKAYTFNVAGTWNFNFYQNLVGQGIYERGFVSPIANVAFLYYDYKWEGQFEENGNVINKIKVIPKRKTDPVWEGYIYITENTWRIHSVDLSFDENRPTDFVKTGNIKIIYTQPAPNSEWVMFSQNFNFTFRLFGFLGSGYTNKVYRNYTLNPQFSEKHFGSDWIIVEKESNQKDSLFWKLIRPIPLLQKEAEDYRKKDSLEVIRNSKPYKDSLDKIANRFKFNNLLFGYTYRNSYKKYSLSFGSPLNDISFNTVEGWVTNLKIGYNREFENNRDFSITPTLRYGFSSKTFYGKLNISYSSNPKRFERWSIEGGKFVEQFNPDVILPSINTTVSLWQRLNFMKLYEKTYGKASYRKEILNGVLLNTSVEYAQRRMLENTTDFSWTRRVQRDYTPNAPLNNELAETDFGENTALLWNVELRYTPKQTYINRPDIRIRLRSRFPTFVVTYRKGINALGSNVDFDQVELGITDTYSKGLVGSGSYRLFAGDFLNRKSLTFVDFQHFDGSRVMFAFPSFRAYQLLDYYAFSTARKYAGVHFEHHFNGFLFNRIPLLKKTHIQEVFTCNYLFTETNGNYLEIGAGLEHIFKVLRVNYFWSFLDGKYFNSGFRFGIGF